jgi:hypothetical protein
MGSRQPKKRRDSPIGAPCFFSAALEQEAAERSDARARPDHDHRQVRVLGRVEGDRRLADEGVQRGVGRLRGEIVR